MKKPISHIFYSPSKIYFVILLLLCLNIFLPFEVNAMGDFMGNMDDLERDKGTIGERKTKEGREIFYDGKTGITYRRHIKGAAFVTPEIIGDIAHFDVMREYSFDFECLGWNYDVSSGYINLTKKELLNWDIANKVIFGWVVNLKSPDSKIGIETKKLNLTALAELNASPTQEQLNILPKAADDPLVGEERILVAQEAIKWVINNDLNDYNLADKTRPFEFGLERIGNKEFIKMVIDITNGIKNKKCSIFAINYWVYRRKPNERRIIVWIAKIISDTDVFTETINQTRMIFETLRFSGLAVYPDLKE